MRPFRPRANFPAMRGLTPGMPQRGLAAGRWGCSGASSWSGQRGFALLEQHLVTDARGEHIVDFLKPGKLGLKVTYSSLQPAHLRDHAGIWPANMAKQSLRHCFEVLHTE